MSLRLEAADRAGRLLDTTTAVTKSWRDLTLLLPQVPRLTLLLLQPSKKLSKQHFFKANFSEKVSCKELSFVALHSVHQDTFNELSKSTLISFQICNQKGEPLLFEDSKFTGT